MKQNRDSGVYFHNMDGEKHGSGVVSALWTILIVLFILGFLVAVAIPNFVGNGRHNPANICINNLLQIDAAANQYAYEHHLTNGDGIDFPNDLTPYIKLDAAGKIRSCPSGGIYHVSKVGETPTCSLGTSVVPAHVLP